MSIHILLHMLVLLHVNNFFSGIYVRLFKFREDFYSRVFNFAIFLQSRKTRNLNFVPRSQSVLRWTLGRGKSRYEISLLQRKNVLLSSFFFRSYLSQRSINPLDRWEILREQIEYDGELGRGAFGVVYKAMLWERVGIEVFSTEISKRKLLSSKTEPRVVAVKVLLGETKNEINAWPYK